VTTVVMARQALKRLDYAEKLPYTTNRPSKIQGPLKWRGHTIPWYRIEWEWETGDAEHSVRFDIDGQRQKITRFFDASTNLWGNPLEISVKPELESEYRKQVIEGKQIYRRNPPPNRLKAP
jgi:hypothetical protein